MSMKNGGDNGGKNMSESRTSTSKYTPKMSISRFMGYLKDKISLMIFQRFGNMKFAYRNREFCCRGYYVDTAGKNTKAIKEYTKKSINAR